MKTLSELLELVSKAMEVGSVSPNEKLSNAEWFIYYHGNVNELSIGYYPLGWSDEDDVVREKCAVYLTENGIQEAYWFINNRLK